jgi:hypothetical protein
MIKARRVGSGCGISTPSRIAASGGTRVARSAGEHGDDDADDQRDDDRARLQHGAAVGQVGAEQLEQLVQSGREPDPREQAEHGADDAEQQPFADDRLHDLPPGGAHRTQQPELSRALRDGDRERVEDDERADHQRDVGEHEQERAQEAQVAFEVGGVLRGLLFAGAHVDAARKHSADAPAQLRWGHAGRGGDVELVVAPSLPGRPLRLGRREHRGSGAAEGLPAAELENADDRVALGRRSAGHDHLGADLQPVTSSCRFVDRHFAGPGGKATLDGRERFEALGQLPGDECRRPAAGQPLALEIQERAGREDAAGGFGDARHSAHLAEHRIGDRRFLRALFAPQRLGRRDDDGVALGGGLEDAGEGPVDRVGEDVRAGHQRDAERDRDGGQHDAQLALQEAAQDEPRHLIRSPSSGRAPRRW